MLEDYVAQNYAERIAALDAQGIDGAAYLRAEAVKNDWPAVVAWIDARKPAKPAKPGKPSEAAAAGPSETR